MPEPENNQEWKEALSKGGGWKQNRTLVLIGIAIGAVVVAAFVLLSGTGGKKKVPDWIPKEPPPRPMSLVEVFSNPVGAKVYLEDGGVPLAQTPGNLRVSQREHTLRFELPGLPVQRVKIDGTADTKAEVSWDAVVVKLVGAPEEEITLMLNNKVIGRPPMTLYFSKGTEAREIKANYKEEERVFVFQATQNLEHNFDFTKPTSEPTTLASSQPASEPTSQPTP